MDCGNKERWGNFCKDEKGAGNEIMGTGWGGEKFTQMGTAGGKFTGCGPDLDNLF